MVSCVARPSGAKHWCLDSIETTGNSMPMTGEDIELPVDFDGSESFTLCR
jgi:hypothetical protein